MTHLTVCGLFQVSFLVLFQILFDDVSNFRYFSGAIIVKLLLDIIFSSWDIEDKNKQNW